MEYWTILLSIVTSLLGIRYLFGSFNYFKKNDILHVPSVLSLLSFAFRRISFVDFLQKLYNLKPDAKYYGFYFINRPVILLRDLELIKEVFVKNFESFPNRRGFNDFNEILLTKNLFSLQGQKWHNVRTILSPSFTPSKMKIMYALMSDHAVDFAKTLAEISEDKGEVDMRDMFSRYMSDVIVKCAFGIKINAVGDSTNEFYLHGKEAVNFIGTRGLAFLFFRTFPTFCKFLGLKFLRNSFTKLFQDTVNTIVATRDAKNIKRPDVIQLMMDVRNKRQESKSELSMDEMVAQAFVFFFGNFDTSSLAVSFLTHEIAANPDVQAKLQREIDKIMRDSNGNVTYEAIIQLKYLDAVINESFRLFPPVLFIERLCERPFKFPPALPNEKSIVLKKGQIIWVPIHAIHRDGKHYDEPDKFNPERFLDANRDSLCFLPFGLGPRMCVAKRFALLQIKVLIFHLLVQCELKPCAKTTLPAKFSKIGIDPKMEGGFWLNVQRRNDM